MTQGNRICWMVNLGVIGYAAACDLQRQLVRARKAQAIPDVLLLCEHPHVITLGRNGNGENLRASSHVLEQMRIEFHLTDRGGDITYHGPGQVVGYPILNLNAHRCDVRWYVEQLEELMIRATAEFGIPAHCKEGAHGIWVDTPAGEEKLAALGVHLSRWVTSHGFAYNVSTDLRYFDLIVPCGIPGKRATSLERLLSRDVARDEVVQRLANQCGSVFGMEMVSMSRLKLQKALVNALRPIAAAENLPAASPATREGLR